VNGWRRLLRDLLDPDEFATIDPVVIEREYIRGAEVVHRVDYKLLDRILRARNP
jgi:type II secretory pathway predicted ATPase ExeA